MDLFAVVAILWLVLFFLNHKSHVRKNLIVLILGSLLIWLVVFAITKEVRIPSIVASVGLFCVLDNLYMIYHRKKNP